jgi:hypothetical protein
VSVLTPQLFQLCLADELLGGSRASLKRKERLNIQFFVLRMLNLDAVSNALGLLYAAFSIKAPLHTLFLLILRVHKMNNEFVAAVFRVVAN